MVANGKLHSLQKIIFFFWRCFGNTVFAMPRYHVVHKGKVLPILVILLTVFILISDQPTMMLANNWANQPTDHCLLESLDNMTNQKQPPYQRKFFYF